MCDVWRIVGKTWFGIAIAIFGGCPIVLMIVAEGAELAAVNPERSRVVERRMAEAEKYIFGDTR